MEQPLYVTVLPPPPPHSLVAIPPDSWFYSSSFQGPHLALDRISSRLGHTSSIAPATGFFWKKQLRDAETSPS